MSYFDNFPTLSYTFESGVTIDVRDIFIKVNASQKNFKNVVHYERYNIKEGERPDVVAAKLYGNSDLYWTFYLVNNFDNFGQWYMGSGEFEKYLGQKYQGQWLNASVSTDIVSYNFDSNPPKSEKFLLGEIVSSGAKQAKVLKLDPTHKRVMVDAESFTANDIVTGSVSSKSFTVSSVSKTIDGVCYYENDSGIRVNVPTAGYDPVTFYTKEFNDNESKRAIKFINPKNINNVISDLEDLL